MPITLLGRGELATIVGLTGSLLLRQQLSELGFSSGRMIEVVQRVVGNNLIVAIQGSRIALDRKMAHHIQVCLNK